jgi:hypothetical protein
MGSPLTAVMEIKTINGDYYSLPEVNFTHLLSPAGTEELRAGLLKPGTIELGGNFIGEATQLAITTMAVANATQTTPTFAWAITAAIQNGTKTYTCTGVGYIAKYKNGPFENGKPVEFSFGLQITGIISEAVA